MAIPPHTFILCGGFAPNKKEDIMTCGNLIIIFVLLWLVKEMMPND